VTGRRVHSLPIGHMLDAMEHARQFIAGPTVEQFAADDRTVYATVWSLEIVGEAAKRVPDAVRALEPDVPWRKMAGMRDVIIHRYDEANVAEVWRTVRDELGETVPRLERLQRVLEQREDEEWQRE
jgi:uncharacterized protein with HEPN domain